MPNFIKWLKDDEKEARSIDIGITSEFSRSPYAGAYPHDYKLPDKLSALRRDLDQHIKDLCEKNAVDAGNYNALDDYIASGIASCLESVNYERAEHQRIINLLLNRWQGDLVDGQEKAADFQKDLNDVELELAQARSRLSASTGSKHKRRSLPDNDPPKDEKCMEVIPHAS